MNEATGLPGFVGIGGTTASGKSLVALEVARQLQGEIVSVDSMQVYRGLDLGTAKPSVADRRDVPHHLLDEVEITEDFSVAQFLERAQSVIAEITRRGRPPVLCGGTGLYFKALLQGLGSSPGPRPELRRRLEALPLPQLLEELRTGDPEAFAQVDRNNPRRVVRAVEVLRLTGQGLLACRAPWSRGGVPQPGFFVLRRSADDLRERIDARVDRMFRDGWVEETRQLLQRGLGANRVALQAIGYRQIVEHLQGLRGLEDTRELIKRRSWQFARRQRNWFERQLPAAILEVPRSEPPAATAARLLARLPQCRGAETAARVD